ncbi:hypothetical protein ACFW04_014027 [Cataglyphis niger]
MLRAHDLLSIVLKEPRHCMEKKDANAQRIIIFSLEKKPLMYILNSEKNPFCKICKKNNNVEKDCYFLLICFLQGEKQENGLYKIDLYPETMNIPLIIEKDSSTENWHKKLGHLSLPEMKKQLDMSNGMNYGKKLEKLCEICMKAIQIINGEKIKTKRPLELIHITLIDDYIHFTIVYLLKYKHETAEIIKEYAQRVETEWSSKISKIRSDNGREYINKNLRN